MIQEPLVGTLLCLACWNEIIAPQQVRGCAICTRPLEGTGTHCEDCVQGSLFSRVFALGLHQGALRAAIHFLKFRGRGELGELLGRRLAHQIKERYDYLVPIPLHRARLRERGYNQAALVTDGIARTTGMTVLESRLVRVKSTTHQTELNRAERFRNLAGAFCVRRGEASWKGRSVLLVDDVLTTGATASAAAQALLESGARQVGLAVLAVSTKAMVAKSLKVPLNICTPNTDTSSDPIDPYAHTHTV